MLKTGKSAIQSNYIRSSYNFHPNGLKLTFFLKVFSTEQSKELKKHQFNFSLNGNRTASLDCTFFGYTICFMFSSFVGAKRGTIVFLLGKTLAFVS